MILNVVHPYTYKLRAKTLNIGPCPETRDRDQAVVSLVEKAMVSSNRVLIHQLFGEGGEMAQMLHLAALGADPVFEPLSDERTEWISTTSYGVPIEDETLDALSEEDREMIQPLSTRSRLGSILGEGETLMFIGGALENCVTNAALYSRKNYRKKAENIFYVPELCATFDPEVMEKSLALLDKGGIIPLTAQEAIQKIGEK